MLSSKYRPYHVPLFLAKYAWLTMRRRPVLVHFEVTMRCNARCGFCDYWKTPASSKASELASFADVARRMKPMLVTFTGGEPLLRRDLEDLVVAVRREVRLTYLSVITHGAMLSLERARSLWNAGIDQFNISLDFLDGRHDTARGIPGLTARILDTVPLMRAAGIDAIRFNSVIRRDNLDQIPLIVRRAADLGIGVNLSLYTDLKNGNIEPAIGDDELAHVDSLVHDLLAFKRHTPGVISSSDYYLETIPRYLRGELRGPCRSGIRTIHVTPEGSVKRCPDFAPDFHWSRFRTYEPIDCNRCYYACRGEAQAPLRISRIRDVLARRRPPHVRTPLPAHGTS
jgi:MoaA/NifB/PqqE/SkfB family radical SAM enzyme